MVNGFPSNGSGGLRIQIQNELREAEEYPLTRISSILNNLKLNMQALNRTLLKKFVEYTNVRSTGTRMPRANWKDMAQYLIAKPSHELVAMFNEIVFRFNMMATGNIQQSQILTQLRDTLLPKLLSGEISVAGAREKMTETV